uniref:MIP18 family-like domain-containing protein n=1 Tax=Eutreptiella gymnastica TaxID=73025 RepID=A0A7S1J9D3_9EUGL|mmetsp:Transcript_77841/g.137250  ORF Transcript_77841/g.137250 Transcript_77841/m.137250 type:complete len:165 (+) Transcript_77841:45-539(+)
MLDNPAPVVTLCPTTTDEPPSDGFDAADVLSIIGPIRDPEHPFSLAQLEVVSKDNIQVHVQPKESFGGGQRMQDEGRIRIVLKPTVAHCSFINHIALCIHARLQDYLPPDIHWKLDLGLVPGSHDRELEVVKQINDKERVCAALENPHLMKEVERCIDDDACIF